MPHDFNNSYCIESFELFLNEAEAFLFKLGYSEFLRFVRWKMLEKRKKHKQEKILVFYRSNRYKTRNESGRKIKFYSSKIKIDRNYPTNSYLFGDKGTRMTFSARSEVAKDCSEKKEIVLKTSFFHRNTSYFS